MNSKLITILLCTSIFLSQTIEVVGGQVCPNSNRNWLATRNAADLAQTLAFQEADRILFIAKDIALRIRTAAFA